IYSASTLNKRLRLKPTPASTCPELPTKAATSSRPMPTPPPPLKVRCSKFDCAEAEATSPQQTTSNSIRLLNLHLLFSCADIHEPTCDATSTSHHSAMTSVFSLRCGCGKRKPAFFQSQFQRRSILSGGRPRRVAHLL